MHPASRHQGIPAKTQTMRRFIVRFAMWHGDSAKASDLLTVLRPVVGGHREFAGRGERNDLGESRFD
jgi:hypothetical protein